MAIVLPSGLVGPETLGDYRLRGGYEGLARAAALGPEGVIGELVASGLRGRGGAAFPTGDKWRLVRDASGPDKVIVANGAEGEPGSMKDRTTMARVPHAVLEGIWLAAYATGAGRAVVYINDEFADAVGAMRAALGEALAAGVASVAGAPPVPVEILAETHVYIAGEETALLNVLMGKAAVPWHKPPYPTEKGLDGLPTLVNNVETLAQAAAVARIGAGAYRQAAPMLFSVSGDVARPGVYELPLGTRLSDLVGAAGGMAGGAAFRAVLPGGYSTPMLGADAFDVALDYDSVRAAGSGLGCSIIVLGAARDLRQVAAEVMEFFSRESCGRCPTCVRGTRTLADALAAGPGDDADLIVQAERLRHKGICSFLDTAARFTASSVGLGAEPADATA